MGSTAGWRQAVGDPGAELVVPLALVLSHPLLGPIGSRGPSPKAAPSCAHLPSPLVIAAAQLGKKVAVVDYVEPSPRGRQPPAGATCPREVGREGQFLVQRAAKPPGTLLARVSREGPDFPVNCHSFKDPRSYVRTTLALAGVSQWLERRPVHLGLQARFPVKGMYLSGRFEPWPSQD